MQTLEQHKLENITMYYREGSSDKVYQCDLPEVKGFSARNLRLMTQFFDEYSSLGPISPRPVAKMEINPAGLS